MKQMCYWYLWQKTWKIWTLISEITQQSGCSNCYGTVTFLITITGTVPYNRITPIPSPSQRYRTRNSLFSFFFISGSFNTQYIYNLQAIVTVVVNQVLRALRPLLVTAVVWTRLLAVFFIILFLLLLLLLLLLLFLLILICIIKISAKVRPLVAGLSAPTVILGFFLLAPTAV